jgi:pyruvate,water dikinase
MNVLWLGEPACANPERTGGKIAALSRLAASFRVPPGFCLTTAAFDDALGSGLIADVSKHEPALRAWLTDDGSQLSRELLAAYQVLSKRVGRAAATTAVRSSGVDEDGSETSFAGQHETYLNVIGIGAITAAVVRCWSSSTAPRALAYRRRHGLSLSSPRLAVLVQQLIVADVSAVIFSANPLTGNRQEVIITASWGLGESLVGGTVTPDTWSVQKRDLAITTRQIGDKQRMTVPWSESPPEAIQSRTREVAVPGMLRMCPVLDDARITELAHLALALEQMEGRPIDAECAYQAGQLYLLQCRPITSLPLT